MKSTGIKQFVDSAISSYFIVLGKFSYDNYSSSPNIYSVWITLILATFMNCVVFMNMLIAIMGQTFKDVNEASEETGLFEQVNLIEDFVGLVNLKTQFNKCRYIIKIELM